jgi:CRP-like cAMP-binding protein
VISVRGVPGGVSVQRPPASCGALERFCRRFAVATDVPLDQLHLLLRSHSQISIQPPCTLPEEVKKPLILLSGWGCDHQILESGRRHIFSFFLPGDFVGLDNESNAFGGQFMAITPCLLVEATALVRPDSLGRFPSLARALDEIEKARRRRLYDQLLRLATQSAAERTRSLIAEIFTRASAAGLGSNNIVPFPLTQEILADTLGLSAVHVNRTVQQLRRAGILSLQRGCLTLKINAMDVGSRVGHAALRRTESRHNLEQARQGPCNSAWKPNAPATA